MSLFDLNPAGDQNVLDQARLNPINPDDLKPGWFAGTWKAPVTGLASAWNDAALLLGDAATPVARSAVRPVDSLFGTNLDQWLVDQQQIARRNITDWAPDPRTTGVIGQAVHGLFNVAPEFMAGGPETAAVLQGYKGMVKGQMDGLDPGTALGVGAIDALSTWVGLKLPMQVLPKFGAAGAAATGAGGNVATGMVTRGATGEWLRINGYGEMADQYKVLDSSAMVLDLLLGGGFGAIAHYGPGAAERFQQWRDREGGKIQPSDIDTALTLNNQLHAELDTAPGIPANPAARAAHTEAVNDALTALMRDDPVIARPDVVEAEFIDNPQAARVREEVALAVEEHLGPEWRALKAELERRGLPTDEIDTSGRVRVTEAQPPRQIEGAAMGAQSAIKVGGQYLPVRWALVDAGTVEATMAKGDNQFRDRTRAASEAQVSRIAAEPDYNLLTDSPIMDFGAPTLTRDGQIVGGNGRFAGVSRSYDRGTHKRYSEPLARNLERYGIDPAAAQGMKKPVLVRVLQADVDVRKAAMASNEGAGLRMSALEQAKVDGERLGGMDGITVGETGRLNTAENRDAIRQWVGQFPATERAALVDASGNLSLEGETRLRNAVLFRAFGDSPTLARLVESTDPGARNVAAALVRTAPAVAEAKAAIEAGALYPLDISADITAAVETLDRLRGEGTKIADYLNQGDMLGSSLSAEARVILSFLDRNIRSSKAMAEMISGYYERVKGAGSPDQGDMFGAPPPSKMQLLNAAIDDTGKGVQAGAADAPFAVKELKQEDIDRLPEAKRGQLQEVYRRAAEVKPTFDEITKAIAQELGGEVKLAPLKGSKRAVDKILADYKGDPTKIKDVLRASIILPDPVRAMAAVEELKASFQVLDSGFRNLFDEGANPADGYRDAKMNIVIDGVTAEVQVHVPEMIKAKSEVHDLYEERSRIEREITAREDGRPTVEELAQIEALNAAMRQVYEPAFAASTSRLNLASETGAPLRRADSAENLRGGSSSQAAQYGKPGTSPSETGMPSTSKNSTDSGNFIDFTSEGSLPDLASVVKNATGVDPERVVLQERPTLRIPGEDGSVVSAAVELAKADAEIATVERESQGFDAAVSCVLRG